MPSTKAKTQKFSQEIWESIDSPILAPDFIRGMKPVSETHPETVERYRHTRGSQKAPTKQQVTLRLDREILVHFQKDGPGWQTRMNDALLSLKRGTELSSNDRPDSDPTVRRVRGSHVHYPIEDIEGIGPRYAAKLKKVGVTRTNHLLDRGASQKGRKDLAKEAGLEDKQILKWANMADLMRVRGVGEEYSELLEAAGVDTVEELKKRKPENLREAMVAANAKRKLVRQLPGMAQVEKWVAYAKELPAVIKY